MPIEIRELVIRVAIDENNPKKTGETLNSADLAELKNKIVKECMQDLLRKIEHLSER